MKQMKSNVITFKSFHNDLLIAKELVYDKCGFDIAEYTIENESQEYGACSYQLNGMTVKFRVSKITPTKTGHFVTIWKRNEKGITQPFDETDQIDFIVISSRNGNNFGQFVFPKSVLIDKRIISGSFHVGKRGIRVYPPWDMAASKQAEETQRWQTKYFLRIHNNDLTDFEFAKKLFEKSSASR